VKNLFSWITVTGAAFVALGIHILITGRLRTVISLGEAKYIIGGMSIVFGLYLLGKVFRRDL
jgi:hypothetical protein